MKKTLALAAMAFLSFGSSALAQTGLTDATTKRIQNAIGTEGVNLDDYVYCLVDIDKDGLAEVIVKEKVREYNNYWVFSQAEGEDEPLMERSSANYQDFFYSENGFVGTTIEASTYNHTQWVKLEKSRVKYTATASETHEEFVNEQGEPDINVETIYSVTMGDKEVADTKEAYNKHTRTEGVTSLYNIDDWKSFPSTGGKGRRNALQEAGRMPNELVPATWEAQIVEGDLNADGIKDLAVLATPDDPAHIEVRSDGFVTNMNQPILAIYFKDEYNVYHLWKQYDNIIAPLDEMQGGGGSIGITERGVLRVRYEDGDCANDNSYITELYRFQDGDFYRIGREEHDFDRMKTHSTHITSYNYNTGKVQHRVILEGGPSPKDRWETLPKEPLCKLGGVHSS